MYQIVYSLKYRKSIKKLNKSGSFKIEELNKVINIIAKGEKLLEKYQDHQLKGEFKEYRECHIKPDILLMYEIKNKELILIIINIGSHSQLFG